MKRLLLVLSCCAASQLSAQDPGDLARAYFSAWSAGDEAALTQLVADGFVRRTAGVADAEGREAVLAVMRSQRQGMSDLTVEVEHLVTEGDRVAAAWRARFTDPSAGPISWTGSTHFRVVDGRIVEERIVGDMLAMYRQRGYALAPPPPAPDAVATLQPRLDHFMWFVDDLDAARALLSDTLGFTVSHGGVLEWGAENRLIWFEDDTYLEPLYRDPTVDNDFWAPFTAMHQGGTHFGLAVNSAARAAEYFAARGLPVTETYAGTFESMGPVAEVPDDMWRVLSNAGGGFLGDLIFWIDYTDAWWDFHRRNPEIDPRRGTNHPNTARRVAQYHLATYNVSMMAANFERLGFEVGEVVELPHLAAAGREVRLTQGSLWLLQPRFLNSPVFVFLRQRGEGVMGAAVEVADLETARQLIEGRSGWELEAHETPWGRSFAIPAARARGTRLEFVQMR